MLLVLLVQAAGRLDFLLNREFVGVHVVVGLFVAINLVVIALLIFLFFSFLVVVNLRLFAALVVG